MEGLRGANDELVAHGSEILARDEEPVVVSRLLKVFSKLSGARPPSPTAFAIKVEAIRRGLVEVPVVLGVVDKGKHGIVAATGT